MAIHEQSLKRKLKQREKAKKRFKLEKQEERQRKSETETSETNEVPSDSEKEDENNIPEFRESELPGTSAGILSTEEFKCLAEKVNLVV